MNLEKTNSVGWAALTVTFLQLTSWEEKTHDGERGQCLPPSPTTGMAVPFASTWKLRESLMWILSVH